MTPRRVALALGLVSAASVSATVLLAHRNGMLDARLDGVTLLLAFNAYLLVGLVLITRRSGHPVGWILAGVGTLTNVGVLAEEWATYGLVTAPGAPGALAAAWFNGWWWLVLLTGVFLFLPMLFPTGRPINGRWAVVTKAAGIAVAVLVVLSALSPELSGQDGRYTVANPVGVSWGDAERGPFAAAAAALSVTAILAAFASVVVRFRRARGIERQQLKWFLYAAGLTVGFGLAGDAGVLPDIITGSQVYSALQFALLPLAIAVAILRYRLYEIDRVISRTLTYALVTAVLVGLYLAAVTTLTAVTATRAGSSPVAVAAATLLAAAAFRPVRRRVQALVDRRFNRARYDAARTLEDYRSRLRDEVQIETLSGELVAAVTETLQPAHVAVWLRPAAEEAAS